MIKQLPMFKALIALFALTLWGNTVTIAQRSLVDSLVKKLPIITDSLSEISLLNNLAWCYKGIANDSVFYYARMALMKAEKTKYVEETIDAMGIIGNYYFMITDYPNALDWFGKQKVEATKQKCQKAIAVALGNIGNVHVEQFNYDKALDCYVQGLKIDNALQNKEGIRHGLSSIGSVYLAIREYDQCIQHARRAGQIALDLQDSSQYIAMQMNIALALNGQKKTEEAKAYFQEVIYYFNRKTDYWNMPSIYANIAVNYEENGFYEEAREYYEVALSKAIDTGNRRMQAKIRFNQGELLQDLGKGEMAITALKEGLRISQKIENPLSLQEMGYKILYEIYKENGDYKKSLFYFEKLNKINDSLYSIRKEKQINTIKIEYETAQKIDSIRFLRARHRNSIAIIQRQYTTVNAMIAGILVLLGIAGLLSYLYSLKQKQKEILEGKNNEIKTLNGELSHRIKNNLMFVSSLMRLQARRLQNSEAKAAVKDAENRVEAMAMVHRELYHQAEHATIEMSDYLKQLSEHLSSSYAMLDCDLTISLGLSRFSLEADAAVQIGLIVNELMTNSFKYAFVGVTYPSIRLVVQKVAPRIIRLNYQDNGKGMPLDFDLKNSNSLGLKLILDLTEQLNGTVDIHNQEGAYFCFEFKGLKITG